MPDFQRTIGIDYSGAQTPQARLPGLRVYESVAGGDAVEVLPRPGTRRHWTRSEVAHWLLERLSDGLPTLVGIDHGFSFPMAYFERHGLAPDWAAFLDDFHAHWPTDLPDVRVDHVRDGLVGRGAERSGDSRWRRLCEQRCRAKSVFHFDVQGSVAKSTHAGLPWLRFLRAALGPRLHCWPFDGWLADAGRSVIAEAYPSLWRAHYPLAGVSGDQQDAYAVACWLRDADASGRLGRALQPPLPEHERAVARVEGWILGL